MVQARKIQQLLGFQNSSLPTSYLGVPLFAGRTKSVHFDYILDKVRSKISGWRAKYLSWGGKITVISSVLNSIPIYALSVLPVPKKTIANIQRCIADFLWNQGDQKRFHWVAWHKVAKPIEEGGLNLKVLQDLSYYWKSNLAWSFLRNNSLWSSFMNQKYSLGSASIFASQLWKDIVPIATVLNSESFWRIGKGQVKIWSQKWWPMDIVFDQQSHLPDITIAEVFNDSTRKDLYLQLLPEELQHFASNIQLNNSDDCLIWKCSDSGLFDSRKLRSLHSEIAGERFSWWRKFWQPWIPTKSSCFLWKCLNHAVPVDEAVQRTMVPFVSKCSCCASGNVETLSHLLLFSEAANSVWNFLKPIFEVNVHYTSIAQAAAVWIRNTHIGTQLGCLKILAFVTAIWEIWKWRNRVIFEQPEEPSIIKQRVIAQLHSHNFLIVPVRKSSWIEEMAISCLLIPPNKVKIQQGKWVKWIPNKQGLTVNLHCSAKNNSLHGSFVIRDGKGVVFACSGNNFPSGHDKLQSLAITLMEALQSVDSSGHRITEIQCDDSNLIDTLSGRKAPPWRWHDLFQLAIRRCADINLNFIATVCNRVAALVSSAALISPIDTQDLLTESDINRALKEDAAGMARWSSG